MEYGDHLELMQSKPSSPKLVNALYTDGTVFGTGRVIAFCAAPTYVIERADGTRFSWRADMTTLKTPTT